MASKQAWCRTLLRLVSKLLLRRLGGWHPNRLGEGLCLGLVSKLLLRRLGGWHPNRLGEGLCLDWYLNSCLGDLGDGLQTGLV